MKKIFFSSMFALFLFTSCENYLDVNEKQSNNANFDAIAPNQMLAGALNNYTNHQLNSLSTYGNRMTYVWGLNSGFTSNDPAWTYTFDSNSYPTLFESTYLFADNFQDILDKQDKFPDYKYHFGIAKIFKVMLMDYATALYGDVPYTEAFKNNIPAPKYDDDKVIIPALFKELDEARAFLSAADGVELGSEDIIFHGDTAEWLKFLNTVELKLVLRLSKTTDANLVALRTARAAQLNAAQNFVTADVTCNPGYNSSDNSKRSPLYRFYGLNEALSDWTSANRANAGGKFIIDILNGTLNNTDINSTGIVDPRRARMFAAVVAGGPGAGTWVGNELGLFPVDPISRMSTFYIGRIGSDENGMIRDAYVMQLAESKFLQAEAMQRGYISGNAQTAFNEGILASMAFNSKLWGTNTTTQIPALNPTAYITAIDSRNGLGWTGSSDKINAIITQKYLALAQWHGIELYIDQQRTGYPKTPLPVGVIQTNAPNRLIYPTSEYSSNSANVPNVSGAEIFTVNAKTPYYLQ